MRGVGIAAGEKNWGFETSENTKNLQKSMFWKTAGGDFLKILQPLRNSPLFLHNLKQGGKFLKELY